MHRQSVVQFLTPAKGGTRFMTIRLTLLSLILAVGLFAQADRGSVVGTITDPSAAAIANVSLQLKNDATNLEYNTVSQENGSFAFLNLPVGVYTLKAHAAGFHG